MNRKGVMSAFVASLHRHNGGVVVALCSCSCLSVTWLRPLCFKMALSLVGKRLVLPQLSRAAFLSTTASSAVASKPSAPAPSVKDVIVDLTFIDPSGARRKVPGLVGKTLHEICEMHGIDIGPASSGAVYEKVRSDTWTEPLYGEGPTSGFDHVLITGPGVETAPPKNRTEERMLNQYWEEDELFPESRLASVIVLTPEMNGMTVYVPDRIVDDIP